MDFEVAMGFIPDIYDFIIVFPLSIIVAIGISIVVGKIKEKFNIKTNYTRKIFHFSIFSIATCLGILYPVHRVAAFGAGCGAVLLIIIVFKKSKHFKMAYSALARPEDCPHMDLYLIVPYLATALGGIIANLVIQELAPVAYLVAGWGDAVGEPFGIKFGTHRYRVPTFTLTYSVRSIEGSVSVMMASMMASVVVLLVTTALTLMSIFAIAIVVGVVVAFSEAISPHGWDNLFTQIATTLVIWVLI